MLKNGEYNPYLGETKFRLRTKSELIEMLVNLTKTTLITVSNERGSVALEEGSKSHYLEVLVENHRLKQNQLLIDYDKGERAYIKILKQWLKNEKQFFESFHNLSSKDRLFFVPKLSSSKNKLLANDLEGTLKDLIEKCPNKENNKLLNQMIQQLARLNQINEKFRNHVVTFEDFTLEINRIRISTLDLIDLVESSE